MSLPKITESLVDSLSYQKNALIATTYADDYVFQGKCFGIENFVTISNADTEFDIVFDTTNVNKDLVALPTKWFTTAGDVNVNLGSCSSYASGTEILPTNRNYQGTDSEVIFKYDVTPTAYVAGSTNLLVGSAATNQNSGGGGLEGSLPIILETGIKYIFRVANNSGAEIKFAFMIYWYEV